MTEYLLRFVIGGLVVSAFAVLGDVLRPKTFAGLFGAAPSVALATLGLSVLHHGRAYAAEEARSMALGAVAFLVYAAIAAILMLRKKYQATPVALLLLLVWLALALGLWYVVLA